MAEDYPSIMPLPILNSIDTNIDILINNTILLGLFLQLIDNMYQFLIQYIKNMGCFIIRTCSTGTLLHIIDVIIQTYK